MDTVRRVSAAASGWNSLPPPPQGDRRDTTGRNLLIGLGVVVVLLVLVFAFLFGRDGGSDRDVATPFDEIVPGETIPDLGTDPFGFPTPGSGLPFRPDSVAVGAGSVWVSDSACGVIVRVDPVTETVTDSIDIGGSASGVTFAEDSVWVGNRDTETVVRLDPETNRVRAAIPIPGSPLGLASGDGTVWAVDPAGGAVHRIDPDTDEVVATVGVGEGPHYVAVNDGAAWVTNVRRWLGLENRPGDRSGGGDRVETEIGALHVIEAQGSVWVTNSLSSDVSRIDRRTNEVVATIGVESSPHAHAFAAGSVWVGTESGRLTRIDPATNQATAVPGVDFDSIDMAVDGNDVWVADGTHGTVVRFDAAAASVTATIDLLEFGDCETFRNEAMTPPDPPSGV